MTAADCALHFEKIRISKNIPNTLFISTAQETQTE